MADGRPAAAAASVDAMDTTQHNDDARGSGRPATSTARSTSIRTAINTVEDVLARFHHASCSLVFEDVPTLGVAGARLVASALVRCEKLVHLVLCGHDIGDEGAGAIAAVLPQCTALWRLLLTDNNIGEHGVRALAAVLPQCKNLATLLMDNNRIGDAGVRLLASVLMRCPSLNGLTLDNNGIGDKGAIALAAALPGHPSLQKLLLGWNDIGRDGALALAHVFRRCPRLQLVYLTENRVCVWLDGANLESTIRYIKERPEEDRTGRRFPPPTSVWTSARASTQTASAVVPVAQIARGAHTTPTEFGAYTAPAAPREAAPATSTVPIPQDAPSAQVAPAKPAAPAPHVAPVTHAAPAALAPSTALAAPAATAPPTAPAAPAAATAPSTALAAPTATAPPPTAPAARAVATAAAASSPARHTTARDALAAAWLRTAIDVFNCPGCERRIVPGQSVLLDHCLHAVCRQCAPHMLQPDGSIKCPSCRVVSTFVGKVLPHHPFIEAELAASEVHACSTCAHLPADDRLPATLKCTSCDPHRLFCEPHALHHRMKSTTHATAPLLYAGAALRCPTHREPLAAYCTDCRSIICLACLASTHPAAKHTTRLLTDTAFVEDMRTRLVRGAAVVRTAAGALVDHASAATVAVAEVDERGAAVHAEIDRVIDVLVGLLERRRKRLHDHCQERCREERDAMQRTREESEHDWRVMISAADLAEQLATGAHLGVNATAVMVRLQAAATARLGAVLDMVPNGPLPTASTLRFQFDASVGEQLNALGEITHGAPDGSSSGGNGSDSASRKRARTDRA